MPIKPRGPKHHSCRKGTLVKVVKRDGTTLYGRFKEPSRKFCLLEGERIPWAQVLRFVKVPSETVHSPARNEGQ